jgi:hypothetical protein
VPAAQSILQGADRFQRLAYFAFLSAKEKETMLIILLVILLVLSVGSYPSWPYSRGWGYYPSGGLGLVLVILVVLLLIGRI